MKPYAFRPIALAIAFGVLSGGGALAQTTMPTPAAGTNPQAQAELAAARSELERAARRVAELSRQLGHAPGAHVQKRIVRRPVLGVLLAPDPQAGVRIAGVTPDSPAAKAGLRSGDRIVSIDGTAVLGSDGELRVDNARKLLARIDTRKPVRLGYARNGRNAVASVTPKLDQQVHVWRGDGPMAFDEDTLPPPGVAPRIHREIVRIGRGGSCKGEQCRLPMLAEAFRWNGLNLASVDPRLGRYFGTGHGVLVLSTGQDLGGLQPGDVIHAIDGKPVTSPREAMAAMHARPAGSRVPVQYLRDRTTATTRITVPKALPLRIPLPPVPPQPPEAPRTPAAPPPPPPPPPPPATATDYEVELRDGGTGIGFTDTADAPLPAAVPIVAEIEVIEVR